GAGKSTASKRLALALGYSLMDTGALYRAVALTALRRKISWDDEPALAKMARRLRVSFAFDGTTNTVMVGNSDVTSAIRTPEISRGASVVSALPAVREALLELQRDLGRGGGVVAEG